MLKVWFIFHFSLISTSILVVVGKFHFPFSLGNQIKSSFIRLFYYGRWKIFLVSPFGLDIFFLSMIRFCLTQVFNEPEHDPIFFNTSIYLLRNGTKSKLVVGPNQIRFFTSSYDGSHDLFVCSLQPKKWLVRLVKVSSCMALSFHYLEMSIKSAYINTEIVCCVRKGNMVANQ